MAERQHLLQRLERRVSVSFDGVRCLNYFEQGGFEIRTAPSGTAASSATLTQRFVVQNDGTIGLGGTQSSYSTTGANMVISNTGNVTVTRNITMGGNINAKYQDVAEWVPVAEEMAAGTVVVVSGTIKNTVVPSQRAYDTRVAGVVSARPGVILGEASATKAKIATTGRVIVRVDATTHPRHGGPPRHQRQIGHGHEVRAP